MENIDIREYIIQNFKDDNEEKIRDSIETTIKFRDEDALIGLGVLFELLWDGFDEDEKAKSVKLINEKIKTVNWQFFIMLVVWLFLVLIYQQQLL